MVEKLIVVDLSPLNKTQNWKRVAEMLQVMKDLKLDKTLSLKEARKFGAERLAEIGVDPSTREFVMLNLHKTPEESFEWRIDIDNLKANILNVLLFPKENLENKQFDGETLFIAGANSKFIEKSDTERIKIHFPRAQFEFIADAGHLVYADQPEKFIEIVSKFLNSHSTQGKGS